MRISLRREPGDSLPMWHGNPPSNPPRYSPPPPPGTGPPPPPKGRTALIVWLVIGALLLLARLVVPTLPFNGTTLNEANSVCSGGLGVFARAFGGHQVVVACNEVSGIMLVLNLLAWAGVALIVVCAVLLYRRPRP